MKSFALITVSVVVVAAPVSAQTARGYEVRTLSARADMITGGNVCELNENASSDLAGGSRPLATLRSLRRVSTLDTAPELGCLAFRT